MTNSIELQTRKLDFDFLLVRFVVNMFFKRIEVAFEARRGAA